MIYKASIISLFLFFLQSISAGYASSSCAEKAFMTEANEEGAYRPDYCFFNAGELIRNVFEKHNLPEEDLEYANVLIIKHKEMKTRFGSFQNDPSYVVLGFPDGYQNRDNIKIWKFHAVVEYRGWIIDLDVRDQEEFFTLPDYLERHFPVYSTDLIRSYKIRNFKWRKDRRYPGVYNDRKDLMFARVPARTYLERYSKSSSANPSRKTERYLNSLDYMTFDEILSEEPQ